MFRLFVIVILTVSVDADLNFTYQMASRCKEHICQKGHVYETFYKIDHEAQKLPPGVDLELHIAILASSNGHILLSPVPDPKIDNPVYEIVVGGGANSFSEIRRNKGKNAKMSANTPSILSPIQFRAFYIRISDGTIEFGKENSTLPLLNYHDVESLTINYFSFASWTGVEAKYLYDCPAPEDYNTTEESPDSTIVERNFTNSEKLRMFLLKDKSPYTAPDPEITVQIDLKITTVFYNAFESVLTTGTAVNLYWNDPTLAWNPSKFNETTNLKFREGEIWRPSFTIYNSNNLGGFGEMDPEMIYVVNSGDATLHFQHTVVTYCNDTDLYAKRWPRDEYICEITLGPWATHETIKMQVFSSNNTTKTILSTIDEMILNEWELLSTRLEIFDAPVHTNNNGSDNMKIIIHIRRRALAYNLVFYTPLLVLVSFLLLSFWTQPLEMNRIWFYVGCVTFLCMGLSYIDYFIPTHTLPTILVLYTNVLMGALIALLTQAILMNPSMSQVYKSQKLEAFISNKALRGAFCLKTRPVGEPVHVYERINEGAVTDGEDSGVYSFPRNQINNIEELQTDSSTEAVGLREELAEIIDKFMFTAYSVVFAILLGMHY